MKNQKGFTLIELMVVIVIIGILAAVAIPRMSGVSDKAKATEAVNAIGAYESLQKAYVIEAEDEGTGPQIGFSEPTGAASKFTYNDSTTAGQISAAPKATLGECESSENFTSTSVYASPTLTINRTASTDCQALAPSFVDTLTF